MAGIYTGAEQLRSDLIKAGVERVGIEPTGGYERGVVRQNSSDQPSASPVTLRDVSVFHLHPMLRPVGPDRGGRA